MQNEAVVTKVKRDNLIVCGFSKEKVNTHVLCRCKRNVDWIVKFVKPVGVENLPTIYFQFDPCPDERLTCKKESILSREATFYFPVNLYGCHMLLDD